MFPIPWGRSELYTRLRTTLEENVLASFIRKYSGKLRPLTLFIIHNLGILEYKGSIEKKGC